MSEEEEDLEGPAEGIEEEVYEDFPLTKELAGEGLSLLCKTGNGLAHAYVRMDLRDKGLTDVSVLNCFVHVRYVDISGNHLRDISPLNALPHLLSLKADHNQITSAQLQELQYLQVASFAHNKISSTEGIAHPMLENLNLAFNCITEVCGMTQQTLPSLRVLDLHGNQLSSTTGLQLPSLQRLYLASNQLAELEGLGALRQLTTLHLRENKLSSLSGLPPSMEALQYLNVRANPIAELSQVNQLQSLPFLRAVVLADSPQLFVACKKECPVSELDDYRLEVLVALRKLERLDKDEFTEEERADAEEVLQQRQEMETDSGNT